MPNKTSYIEGDHFEPYGMVVLAHYNDGSDSVVPFYSISPNGSLRTSDTNVVVSAFNLDISVPITVRAVPTSGYFIDVNLSSSEYGGNPGINTADGSIFFECSEITARSGLASFGVAIRYSSGMTEVESDLIKGLPKGFRTTLHQFLIRDGVDDRGDSTGHDWINIGLTILSAAAIVGGIVLCATGVGGIAGGVLLGAGAGSLISGYVNEANNGSFVGGWVGGAISGALCGTGAGIGGSLFIAATETVDLATIGLLSAGVGTSFAGGFLGNFIGSSVTSIIDGNTIDYGRLALDSTVMGSLNIIAGFLSSASGITSATGRVETNLNSKFALRFVSGLIAGGTETIYDLVSWLYGKIRSNF